MVAFTESPDKDPTGEKIFAPCPQLLTRADAAGFTMGAMSSAIEIAIEHLQSIGKKGVSAQKARNRALSILTSGQKCFHDFKGFKPGKD